MLLCVWHNERVALGGNVGLPRRATWRMRNFIKLHSCFGKLITKLCCCLAPNELHSYTCTRIY